jgi:hypothetical protein
MEPEATFTSTISDQDPDALAPSPRYQHQQPAGIPQSRDPPAVGRRSKRGEEREVLVAGVEAEVTSEKAGAEAEDEAEEGDEAGDEGGEGKEEETLTRSVQKKGEAAKGLLELIGSRGRGRTRVDEMGVE